MDAADETDKSHTGEKEEEEEEKSKSSGSMSSIADAELPPRWFFQINLIRFVSYDFTTGENFSFFRLFKIFLEEEGAARIRSLC